MTLNPDFTGTPLFDVEFSETIQDRHMVTADYVIESDTAVCDLFNCAIAIDLN